MARAIERGRFLGDRYGVGCRRNLLRRPITPPPFLLVGFLGGGGGFVHVLHEGFELFLEEAVLLFEFFDALLHGGGGGARRRD